MQHHEHRKITITLLYQCLHGLESNETAAEMVASTRKQFEADFDKYRGWDRLQKACAYSSSIVLLEAIQREEEKRAELREKIPFDERDQT